MFYTARNFHLRYKPFNIRVESRDLPKTILIFVEIQPIKILVWKFCESPSFCSCLCKLVHAVKTMDFLHNEVIIQWLYLVESLGYNQAVEIGNVQKISIHSEAV